MLKHSLPPLFTVLYSFPSSVHANTDRTLVPLNGACPRFSRMAGRSLPVTWQPRNNWQQRSCVVQPDRAISVCHTGARWAASDLSISVLQHLWHVARHVQVSSQSPRVECIQLLFKSNGDMPCLSSIKKKDLQNVQSVKKLLHQLPKVSLTTSEGLPDKPGKLSLNHYAACYSQKQISYGIIYC